MKASQFSHTLNHTPPPPTILPVLGKVKTTYILWHGYYKVLPKSVRHSLGQRIDTLFIEIIEAIVAASFLSRTEKLSFVRRAIQKLDTVKILLLVLWEVEGLTNKRYTALSLPLDEIGKMLGGWNGQLTKQNSPK